MRPDMAKIIVERPRKNSHLKSINDKLDWQTTPIDEWPRRGKMHKTDKYLNETLQPLERYLRSNVNRPWNKVYSEISQNIDRGNAVQAHILQHLFEYVAVNAMIVDGRIVDLRNLSRFRHNYEPPLYVDPRTGILRENKRARRHLWRAPYVPPKFKKIAASVYLAELNGVWFEVHTRPANFHTEYFDVALNRKIFRSDDPSGLESRSLLASHYGKQVVAVSKRSLRPQEIKRHGLRRHIPLPNIVR